jgi:hypothetical protein
LTWHASTPHRGKILPASPAVFDFVPGYLSTLI